jgi:hypothetical protein
MYAVHVMYPRTEGVTFDYDWYFSVHMPMGLGLLERHTGVKPKQILFTRDTFGPDRTDRSSQFFVIGTLVFDERAEAEAFIDLFEMPEPEAMLSADWPKFTGADPIVVLGRFDELDADDYIAVSAAPIEAATAELRASQRTA